MISDNVNDYHNTSNLRCIDHDEDLAGIENNFNIPTTAQTSEPFFTQNANEFNNFQHIYIQNDKELTPQSENIPNFDSENLIQAPLQVNTQNIDYAKTSKNIDVRRLKQVIWRILRNSGDHTNNKVNTQKKILIIIKFLG